MNEQHSPFYGEPDLSQVASRVGWEFLKLCRGETTETPPAHLARLALDLCRAVEAAQALVAGERIDEIPGLGGIPAARQRMLMAERERGGRDTSKYQKVVVYACTYSDVIEDLASGKRQPNPEELEQLREHFASLSLVLAVANL